MQGVFFFTLSIMVHTLLITAIKHKKVKMVIGLKLKDSFKAQNKLSLPGREYDD